jgi:hypothetical protein
MSSTTTVYARRPYGRKTNQMAAIQNSIKQLRVETNPNIKPRACRANPPPIAAPLSKWHNRTVQITKTDGGTNATFTLGDVVANLNGLATPNTTYRIKSIKVWNSSLGKPLTATISPTSFMIAGAGQAGSQTLSHKDFGTGTSLASAHFNIPDTLALAVNVNSGTTATFMTVSAANSELVCHVSIEFLM